jgi:hypothetical protein
VIYRLLATHLAHKAGRTRNEAATGAVTLVQRSGSALTKSLPAILSSRSTSLQDWRHWCRGHV